MKKRVGSYKGKPIVELGEERKNILTKNEIASENINSNSVSKYSPSYYEIIDINSIEILLGLCSVIKFKDKNNKVYIKATELFRNTPNCEYKDIKQMCMIPIYDSTLGFCYNIEDYINILNNTGQAGFASSLQSSIIRISEEEFYDITNI